MASPKIIPKKSVISKVPLSTDLESGEICINHADRKLYAKHPSTGAIQEIGAYSHSHDELYSLNGTQHLELQNNGSLVLNGSTTLTLPSASGTLATLSDITVGGGGVSSVAGRTGAVTLTLADVPNAVGSVTTGIVPATPITNMMQITSVGYGNITPAANTLYIIVG